MSRYGKLGPFETLGLLSMASHREIEHRGETLSAVLKLGLTPPEPDAIPLPEGAERTPEDVLEAVRILRDPSRWLQEVLLWPDGSVAGRALELAADLMENAHGQPDEPVVLARQLAHQYLAELLTRLEPTDQPDRWVQQQCEPTEHSQLDLRATWNDEKEKGESRG